MATAMRVVHKYRHRKDIHDYMQPVAVDGFDIIVTHKLENSYVDVVCEGSALAVTILPQFLRERKYESQKTIYKLLKTPDAPAFHEPYYVVSRELFMPFAVCWCSRYQVRLILALNRAALHLPTKHVLCSNIRFAAGIQ